MWCASACFLQRCRPYNPLHFEMFLSKAITVHLYNILYTLKVCVGRSELVRGKKKIDKEFGFVKINVHKGASYSRLLEKCADAVWGTVEEEHYTFSLLDTKGMSISEKLIVDHPDGSDRELPWSLETYVKITKKTYTTQPKFIVHRDDPAVGNVIVSLIP